MGALSGMFMAPPFLAFLGLLPVVVLLYILKLRRTEVIVPSTMLWIKSLQDLTANAPFQRLRKNLLLLLQLLILALLALGLARPFVRAKGAAGSQICLMIDHSASMQTLEDGTTRLKLAKAKAHEMVNEMGRGDKMMVVGFAERAEVLCELTGDRYRIRNAIDSIVATDTPTRIRDAMLMAHSLNKSAAGPVENGGAGVEQFSVASVHVVVMSDGNISDIEDVGTRNLDVSFVQIGETTDNAGIVAFSERALDEATRSSKHQSFVLIHNEHSEELSTTVSLYFAPKVEGPGETGPSVPKEDDYQLLAVEEVAIKAQSSTEVLFSHGNLGQGILKVELDHSDRLAVDNVAWLALRPASHVKTLLVAEGDSMGGYYIKRALMLEPRIELSAVTPDDFVATDEYDLVVFDGFAPNELPDGTLLFFNAFPQLESLVQLGEIENPPVLAKNTEHPVMRFLNPTTVGIMKAQKLGLPPGAQPLLSTEGAPLIADVSNAKQNILIVAFDLAQSNWPWHLSFPLFMQNVVSWVPRLALSEEKSVDTGSALGFAPLPDGYEATVRRPDGAQEKLELDPASNTYYGNTTMAGIYHVKRNQIQENYAVNLLDISETAINPAAALDMGHGEVEAVRGSVRQNRELWRWLVLVAVVVLGIEWWIYSRRAWI